MRVPDWLVFKGGQKRINHFGGPILNDRATVASTRELVQGATGVIPCALILEEPHFEGPSLHVIRGLTKALAGLGLGVVQHLSRVSTQLPNRVPSHGTPRSPEAVRQAALKQRPLRIRFEQMPGPQPPRRKRGTAWAVETRRAGRLSLNMTCLFKR